MRFPFDPTLALLPDGRIPMYFTSHAAQTGEEDLPAIYSAISGDGVHYEFEPGKRFALEKRPVIDCAVACIGEYFISFPLITDRLRKKGIARNTGYGPRGGWIFIATGPPHPERRAQKSKCDSSLQHEVTEKIYIYDVKRIGIKVAIFSPNKRA